MDSYTPYYKVDISTNTLLAEGDTTMEMYTPTEKHFNQHPPRGG